MKQFLLTALALVAFATSKAQQVKLNVILKPIQTLVVNDEQKTVNLEYTTANDYLNGVGKTNQDHLTIYSTGGFQVKVKANNANMQLSGKTMAVNTVKLTASAGSQALINATYQQDMELTGGETTLVSSGNGAVNKNVTVKYQGAGANTYIDNYVPNQNPSTYTADLTYTIISA
ncbi:hypothetical protein SAMN05421857_2655 [Chryseobacterium formosense]|uniref:hypothetical protein n=1 Tax=Chryseobacterium formosense TaxID=236814 RepID=UPI00068A0D15|nr:hypothetical protein [Chryseobacterium formosense]SFT71450.1 hypothetical protein SAMN05421857_2655 [Chryseobacterium formosense]